MDTGKEYIKMCEKAHEIQEFKNEYLNGDIIYNYSTENLKNEKSVGIYMEVEDTYYSITNNDETIWLPRQDQLQEIVCINWKDFNLDVLKDWYKFIMKLSPLNSMERMWLKYTMYKIYNKEWNSKEEQWQLIV